MKRALVATALTLGLVLVSAASPAEARKRPQPAPTYPGYSCQMVYSGGGWIGYCW
jgi:hypothetical protein